MINERLLNDINEIYERVVNRGISDSDFLEYISSNLNLPCEEGWEIIEEKLGECGLYIEEKYPKPYGYNVLAYTNDYGEDGPSFRIDLVDCSPFKIEIKMIESYYNPVDNFDYDLDFSPIYVDWGSFIDIVKDKGIKNFEEFDKLEDEEISAMVDECICSNDNWESSEIDFKEVVVKEVEEVWDFLYINIKEMKNYYNTLDKFEFNSKHAIMVAKDKVFEYFKGITNMYGCDE